MYIRHTQLYVLCLLEYFFSVPEVNRLAWVLIWDVRIMRVVPDGCSAEGRSRKFLERRSGRAQ